MRKEACSIFELTRCKAAMAAVRAHWSEAVMIPLDDGETQADIDTAQDLELLNVKSETQGRLL